VPRASPEHNSDLQDLRAQPAVMPDQRVRRRSRKLGSEKSRSLISGDAVPRNYASPISVTVSRIQFPVKNSEARNHASPIRMPVIGVHIDAPYTEPRQRTCSPYMAVRGIQLIIADTEPW
jgi:hypothetical protein